MSAIKPTYKALKSYFSVSKGKIIWKTSATGRRSHVVGDEVYGVLANNGYLMIGAHRNGDTVRCLYHRALWMLVNKRDVPRGFEVHHIDKNRTNNTMSNLRLENIVEHRRSHSLATMISAQTGDLGLLGVSFTDTAFKITATRGNKKRCASAKTAVDAVNKYWAYREEFDSKEYKKERNQQLKIAKAIDASNNFKPSLTKSVKGKLGLLGVYKIPSGYCAMYRPIGKTASLRKTFTKASDAVNQYWSWKSEYHPDVDFSNELEEQLKTAAGFDL